MSHYTDLAVESCGLSILTFGMNRAITCTALGPYEQKKVFARRTLVNLVCELVSGRCGMTVHFEDDISGLQASIFRGTGWTDILNNRSMKLLRRIDLLFDIRSQIAHGKSQLSALRSFSIVVFGDVGVFLELADSQIDRHRFTIAKNAECDVRAGGELAHCNL